MRVPFLDLGRQIGQIRAEITTAIETVIDSRQFILGPAVEEAESAIAAKLSAPHAVGVGSGSDALLLALMAANIGPDDDVIVPAFTFFSTASAAVRLGAHVVFADIDSGTFQIDPNEIRRRITPRTRAMMVPHLFGDCAEMLQIQTIAADHGILLIEDVAQAFGAKHRGRAAGTMGFCGCCSFYPTKTLAAMGDAGMIVTHDSATADRLRLLRAHGLENAYEHNVLGVASRLDSLQAAILTVRLRYLDAGNTRRRQIASRYMGGLEDLVTLPAPPEHNEPVYNYFVVRTPERDALREFLGGHGIGTELYYPIPLHLQRGLGASCGLPGDFPRAEEAARTCLALPMFPELREDEIDYVIEKIQEFFQ